MDSKQGLKELYLHELQDAYSAETQITQALPKVIDAVSDLKLKKALTDHLDQTKKHKEIISELASSQGGSPGGEKCDGMAGLLKEGSKIIEEFEAGPVRDAALIGACQKVEHYEISAYGTLKVFADHLDRHDDVTRLDEILQQEFEADELLSEIAESAVNWKAAEEPSASK